tara:strand:+ start:110 stop:1504 length:1395 start_codon:yes stop_codon:yes gene_type:complete
MSQKQIITFLFCILFFNCKGSKDKGKFETRPNIVLIIGDDHGYPYFGFMGSDFIFTPNMDSLAESGVLFTNGYVPENHCRPALQSLITGTLPIDYQSKVEKIKFDEMQKDSFLEMSEKEQNSWKKNFNYHSMKYMQTLPGLLKERGYVSFQAGKWWEYHYEYGGFTDGMTKGWVRENKNGRNWFQQFMGGAGTDIGRITNNPVFDFIEKNKQNPFFIWYAPQLPHYPFDAPDKYIQKYEGKGFSKSAIQYYANCTWFDDSVGELIKYFRTNNLYNNTLFIYVNDNGWEQEPNQEYFDDPMRSHNGGDKGKLSVYDQSFRTPIIFSWKNSLKSNLRRDDLIHSTDIPATILDFTGINIPDDYHGISYKNAIYNKTFNSRKEIIGNGKKIRDTSENGDPMGLDTEYYWIRKGEWFFSWDKAHGKKELYNIKNDPYSTTNLTNENLSILSEFSKKLEVWKKNHSKIE